MVNIVAKENSVLNKFIAEIRSVEIQGDSMRFRRNLERIGEVLAYEISKTLEYEVRQIETPLGVAPVAMINNDIVLATIMRAGVPFHNGFLNYFDDAASAFIAAYRKSHKDNSFEVKVEYISCGDLTDKVLILIDPMLATGSSLVLAYQAICEKCGEPRHTHVAAAVSSEQGVDYLKQNMPMSKVSIWTAVLDEELTSKFYIVPGIGDAGDLAYGKKL
ncbi:MAG: uracil phosphoribosyltransferase [Rikenellaceae bacterium]